MSGVGKTTLGEKLLSRLHNWAACKVTACIGGERHRCPRGKGTECGVCSSLKENYVIEDSREIIEEEGSDTARLKTAGAQKVLWIKAKPRYIGHALQEGLQALSPYNGVLFEGNHALKYLNPDLAVMIRSQNNRVKRSAREVLEKVDMFVDCDFDGAVVEKIIEVVE
ncbi:MAG: hypothetical protein AMS17_13550 [Spirochaetes bacterium DG_61]|nr:MAG: hypothetical protein AMS17_13550 [Spirochaetes bacterium DG_61]